MKPFIKAISMVAGLAAITAAETATADTITQTKTFNFVPDGNQTLTFNQYGGSGTVTKITVTVSLTKSGGSYSVDNDSANTGTITLTQKITGTLSSDDVALYSTRPIGSGTKLVATSTTTHSIGATTGDSTSQFDTQPGKADYFTWTPSNATVSDTGNINSGMYTDGNKGYIGNSTFNVDISGIQSQTTTGVSGLAGAYTASDASGFVTITYEGTNLVPEPTSAMLLLIGSSVGLLMRRRRRN